MSLTKINSIFLIATIGLLLLVAVLFLPANDSGHQAKSGDNVVRVGWIGPVSGPVSIIGVDSQKAVYLALDALHAENPENKFEYFFEDDQYLYKNTLIKYAKLVKENNIDLLVLATYSAVKKLSELAVDDGVILINAIDNDKNLASNSGNTFLIAKKTESLAKLIVNQLQKLGKERILVINYRDDEFMPLLSDSVRSEIRARGLQSLSETYSRRITNFRPIIKSSTAFSPDAFVLLGYENIGIAIRQIREAGYLDAPLFTANLGLPVREMAGKYAEGVYYTDFTELDGAKNKVTKFIDEFQSRFNKKPDLLWTATQTYDALNIALPLFYGSNNIKLTAGEVLQRLYDVRRFEGLSGAISILPDGSSEGLEWSLYQENNGQAIRVIGAEDRNASE